MERGRKSFLRFEAPWGPMAAAEIGGRLTDVFWIGESALTGAGERSTPLLAETARQIREYLAGARRSFDLPLALEGTGFQRRVLEAILSVPYGETRSYGDIARLAGRPRAARAVGTVNRDCRLAVVVPCHRIVRADGSLAGDEGGRRGRLLRLEERGLSGPG